jgi:hypothetical protein
MTATASIEQAPTTVVIGRKRYAFTTFAEVSRAYRATIEAMNIGASRTPRCVILGSDGREVARVAYNGRVFGMAGEVLYDTPSYAAYLAEKAGAA